MQYSEDAFESAEITIDKSITNRLGWKGVQSFWRDSR